MPVALALHRAPNRAFRSLARLLPRAVDLRADPNSLPSPIAPAARRSQVHGSGASNLRARPVRVVKGPRSVVRAAVTDPDVIAQRVAEAAQMEALEIDLLGHLGFRNPYDDEQPPEGLQL